MTFGALWEFVAHSGRTATATIEAIMYAVRERGVAALREPANIKRLSGCDQEARDEINNRIARLVAAGKVES